MKKNIKECFKKNGHIRMDRNKMENIKKMKIKIEEFMTHNFSREDKKCINDFVRGNIIRIKDIQNIIKSSEYPDVLECNLVIFEVDFEHFNEILYLKITKNKLTVFSEGSSDSAPEEISIVSLGQVIIK